MHLKIAICDDDINIQFAIEGYLQQLCGEYNIDLETECFDSGDRLCDNYEKGKFDLIFLDIEYKGKNGVETGRYIRETACDETVQIAYISGNTGYAMDLFEYHPINFLVKPVSEQEVKRVIDKCLFYLFACVLLCGAGLAKSCALSRYQCTAGLVGNVRCTDYED